METLGDKIKKMRIESNLKQNDLAEILCVSEKTISSWENDRTKPDLNMIYKLSDYFKKSFYYLINDYLNLENTNEMQIKLKVDEKEYNRILNLINKKCNKKRCINQYDIYYSLTKKNEWLRTRNENGKYTLNYKKKKNNNIYEKYDVLVDNINNLEKILLSLDLKKIGVINKMRESFIYKDNYEINFDKVENIGYFIEIKLLNKSNNINNDLSNLLNELNKFKINLNMIDKNKYIDYL